MEIVVEEASFGDTEAAKRRLKELKDFPHLELNDKIEEITQVYMDIRYPRKIFSRCRSSCGCFRA